MPDDYLLPSLVASIILGALAFGVLYVAGSVEANRQTRRHEARMDRAGRPSDEDGGW